MNGMIDLMGGGPMISGTWINQRTGEQVTVRDSYMDGEHMYVILTDGRTLDLADFQNYVQMSEEEYDENGNKIDANVSAVKSTGKKEDKSNVDPSVVFSGMSSSNNNVATTLKNFENNELGIADKAATEESPSLRSPGKEAAMKVLSKVSKPVFSISVDWPDFPEKELQMCKDYFDTTDDDIVDSIIRLFCNPSMLEDAIKDWAGSHLEKK